MDSTEKFIVELLKEGDEHAYRYLYDRHYPILCHVAAQYVGDDFLAETIVSDVIFDVVSGKILSLVVPGPYRFLGILGRCEDYVIPWGAIRKIGDDIILVESDCSPRCDKRQKRQWI